MKKIVLLLSILIIISACTDKNAVPKPQKPIDKIVMENILYDLALLQALKSYSPEKLTENNINSKTYIYQKYKIDSLQFVENNKYFASNTEEYNAMFERVALRLQNQKTKLDTLLKKENQKKDSLTKTNKKKKILIRG